MAPQHPIDEDEDSNTGVAIRVEIGEEMESEVAPPPITFESRLKSNQDRDAAREGATRGTKHAMSPSRGESSSKLPVSSSPSHGKVAPMKQRKVLSTLGGRKVGASGDAAKVSKPKTSESGPAKAAAIVAPPRRTMRTARK